MVSLREPDWDRLSVTPLIRRQNLDTRRGPADDRAQLDENRRTVGVIGVVENGKISVAWYFRLNREFDRTGTFVLGSDVQLGYYAPTDLDTVEEVAIAGNLNKNVPATPLTPNKEYRFESGVLAVDDPTTEYFADCGSQSHGDPAGHQHHPKRSVEARSLQMRGDVPHFPVLGQDCRLSVIPARIVPLSGTAVEDQGGRPDIRADGSSTSTTATGSATAAAFTHDGAATRSMPTC